MKSTPDKDTTPEQKMVNFQDGLRKVLNCSKTQLNNALEFEKQWNADRPKRGPKPKRRRGRPSSAHASRAKD